MNSLAVLRCSRKRCSLVAATGDRLDHRSVLACSMML